MPKAIQTLFAQPQFRGDWVCNVLQPHFTQKYPGYVQGPPLQTQGSKLDEKKLVGKGYVGVYYQSVQR